MSTNVAAEESRPAAEPASQPASRARASPGGIRRLAYSRSRGRAPIAAARDVTAGQSARAAVTTRAKYSRYISRPVATANYPQSRAGGRRRRIGGSVERSGFLSACAVRERGARHGHAGHAEEGRNSDAPFEAGRGLARRSLKRDGSLASRSGKPTRGNVAAEGRRVASLASNS